MSDDKDTFISCSAQSYLVKSICIKSSYLLMFPCYEFIYTVRFVRVRGKFVSNVCACLYLMSGAMPWALIHKKGYKQAGRRFLESQNTL